MNDFEIGKRAVITKGHATGFGGVITAVHPNNRLDIKLDSGHILPGVNPANVKLSRLPATEGNNGRTEH